MGSENFSKRLRLKTFRIRARTPVQCAAFSSSSQMTAKEIGRAKGPGEPVPQQKESPTCRRVLPAQDDGPPPHTTPEPPELSPTQPSWSQATITATSAATDEAQMIVALGHVMMTFRSAETVSAVITGFATVRAALAGADGQAPHPAQPGAEFGAAAISVLWLDSPEHTAVPHHRYSSEQRRTIHWVDLHMGPVTWRITDRIGYDTLMAELRRVHRAAVGVFLDGSRYRRDPAKLLDVFDDV